MNRLRIEDFATRAAWTEAAAERLVSALSEALAQRGRAVFAASGGSTPEPIYRRMAEADLDWARVTVTLVDERYVPESSDQSNAALIRRTLLQGRAAAAKFIPLFHPSVTVDRAALLASHALAAETDRLDAVLLGMGEDGHICSMFPGGPTLPALLATDRRPAVLGVPQGRDGAPPSLERLSMNLTWLEGASYLALALTGKPKRAVFEQEAAADPRTRPVAALIAALKPGKAPLDVLWTETAP